MEEEVDDGFYSMEELLREEGLLNNVTSDVPETWASDLVRREGGELTNSQRKFIALKLMCMKKENKLPRGAISQIAREVGVHRSTICRIFKAAEDQAEQGSNVDVSNKKKGKCGRKPMVFSEEWLQSAPLHLRTTYRAYAGALKCSHMHVFRLLKKGQLRVHTNNNHPTVTGKHKTARIKLVLSHIIPPTHSSKARFVDMKHVIHIDEKRFYLNPDMRRFYLLPSDMDPYRSCQSKKFKIKAMFMGVTSRPIFDVFGNLVHDGKFGIFPFSYKQTAKKKSKNRAAGTVETKAVQSVTQDVMRDMIINKAIPSIMEKWPACLSKNIDIQQDNAKPHFQDNDPQFREAATQQGFNMKLICQPSQSPDLNVLDLGLFREIQILQYQSFPQNLDDLIHKVEQAYWDFDPHLIKFTWLQLQYVMVEILKVKGGNNYKNPHVRKARLERIGQLPEQVEVEQQIIDDAVTYLNDRCVDIESDVLRFEDGMDVDAD